VTKDIFTALYKSYSQPRTFSQIHLVKWIFCPTWIFKQDIIKFRVAVEEFSTREANLLYLQEPKNHICLPFCDFCKWRYKGQADKGPCGLNFLPFCFIDCSNLAQSMNIHLRLYVLFIFHRRQAYSDLATVDYKCIKDSVIQNLIMSLNKQGNPFLWSWEKQSLFVLSDKYLLPIRASIPRVRVSIRLSRLP